LLFSLRGGRIRHIEERIAGAAARPGQEVKGKQVKILYDLVTVSRMHMTMFDTATGSFWSWEGGHGRQAVSQETCQLLVQEF